MTVVKCTLAKCVLHDVVKHGCYRHDVVRNRDSSQNTTSRIPASMFIAEHATEGAIACDVMSRAAKVMVAELTLFV